MSMQDPIADLLTRIRNGQMASKAFVEVPYSSTKREILSVMQDEGYVGLVTLQENGVHKTLRVMLRYFEGSPVIRRLERVSRPGLRIYKQKNELPKIMGGLGISIVSTSKGVLTDRRAKSLGVGGEVLCVVS